LSLCRQIPPDKVGKDSARTNQGNTVNPLPVIKSYNVGTVGCQEMKYTIQGYKHTQCYAPDSVVFYPGFLYQKKKSFGAEMNHSYEV
jgi:hypothetical protein